VHDVLLEATVQAVPDEVGGEARSSNSKGGMVDEACRQRQRYPQQRDGLGVCEDASGRTEEGSQGVYMGHAVERLGRVPPTRLAAGELGDGPAEMDAAIFHDHFKQLYGRAPSGKMEVLKHVSKHIPKQHVLTPHGS
jgi:hypothetical protein